jgi:glycosyltransferase involved in cell wall biosynthesis
LRVLFDTSVTDFDRGGTTRYVASLLPRLRSATRSGRGGAAEGGVVVEQVSMQATWRWSAILPRAARVLLHDLAWVPWGSVRLGRARGADLYHGAGFKVPPRAPFSTCVSIMDDTPWDDPPTARPYNRVYMRRLLESAAPHLAGALTIAHSTATAIGGRLPALAGRLHVTPLGVDHQVFRPRPEPEVRAAEASAGIAAPYALLVSPYGPRKNLARMLDALAQARDANPGLRALVVGRHDPLPDTGGIPVVACGPVGDNQLAALYSGAEFLLFASLKEGFGLPAVEAMACGCPVVTSRGTAMEEVGADAVVLADPTSTAAMAAACRGLLSDRSLRDRHVRMGLARAAEFTWEATARLTLSAWEKMVR